MRHLGSYHSPPTHGRYSFHGSLLDKWCSNLRWLLWLTAISLISRMYSFFWHCTETTSQYLSAGVTLYKANPLSIKENTLQYIKVTVVFLHSPFPLKNHCFFTIVHKTCFPDATSHFTFIKPLPCPTGQAFP